MSLKVVNSSNIENEHICCAISNQKNDNRVTSKKTWLKERFKDQLVFLKLDERGKVFIEYIPSEKAFAPINAKDYHYINCFWVSGKYKGKGYADKLLEKCIEDSKAKGKKGLIALGSKKKMHFLSDPSYLKYKGFKVCDSLESGFELLYLPFEDSELPKFKSCTKEAMTFEEEVVIYYSQGCPHTIKYVPIMESVLKERSVSYKIIKLEILEQAQNAKVPCTNFALIIRNSFVTSEILTEKKLHKYLDEFNHD